MADFLVDMAGTFISENYRNIWNSETYSGHLPMARIILQAALPCGKATSNQSAPKWRKVMSRGHRLDEFCRCGNAAWSMARPLWWTSQWRLSQNWDSLMDLYSDPILPRSVGVRYKGISLYWSCGQFEPSEMPVLRRQIPGISNICIFIRSLFVVYCSHYDRTMFGSTFPRILCQS